MTKFIECDSIPGCSGVIYKNDTYQVIGRKIRGTDNKDYIWLSIRRIDRTPCHDWRDFQAIKNALVGPEYEAVEIYPAENRLVDGANQYHLWVSMDPTYRFPFGFTERLVCSNPQDIHPGYKGKQRAL